MQALEVPNKLGHCARSFQDFPRPPCVKYKEILDGQSGPPRSSHLAAEDSALERVHAFKSIAAVIHQDRPFHLLGAERERFGAAEERLDVVRTVILVPGVLIDGLPIDS